MTEAATDSEREREKEAETDSERETDILRERGRQRHRRGQEINRERHTHTRIHRHTEGERIGDKRRENSNHKVAANMEDWWDSQDRQDRQYRGRTWRDRQDRQDRGRTWRDRQDRQDRGRTWRDRQNRQDDVIAVVAPDQKGYVTKERQHGLRQRLQVVGRRRGDGLGLGLLDVSPGQDNMRDGRDNTQDRWDGCGTGRAARAASVDTSFDITVRVVTDAGDDDGGYASKQERCKQARMPLQIICPHQRFGDPAFTWMATLPSPGWRPCLHLDGDPAFTWMASLPSPGWRPCLHLK